MTVLAGTPTFVRALQQLLLEISGAASYTQTTLIACGNRSGDLSVLRLHSIERSRGTRLCGLRANVAHPSRGLRLFQCVREGRLRSLATCN